VAPTRFAAGIPHKVHQAAARGLPAVVTPLIADQLGWKQGQEILVGTDAQSFAKACLNLYGDSETWMAVRMAALNAVKKECDPHGFNATLNELYARSVRTERGPALAANEP
jgi:hypothetical protein